MSSKAALSQLVFAVYVLMLVHTIIPHSHGMLLMRQTLQTLTICTNDSNNGGHRVMHHKMPRHMHPQHSMYYVVKADNMPVSPAFTTTLYNTGISTHTPVPAEHEPDKPLHCYILPGIPSPFTLAVPLRAPPFV